MRFPGALAKAWTRTGRVLLGLSLVAGMVRRGLMGFLKHRHQYAVQRLWVRVLREPLFRLPEAHMKPDPATLELR